MYCANCGTPRTQGLSYCNRCGADLREHVEPSNTKAIAAFITAITLIGVSGLAIMLAGALLLRKGANLSQELIVIFMLFTFLIVSMTEILLFRNLSKLSASTEHKNSFPAPLPTQHDLRLPQGTPLGEPVGSVTENTTRTLEYVRRELSES
jgi:hypothetical protein